MKCEKCGREIREGVKFCPKCGHKVIVSVQPPDEDVTCLLEYKEEKTSLLPFEKTGDQEKMPETEKRQTTGPAVVICQQCGAPNPAIGKFCSVCGTTLEQEKSAGNAGQKLKKRAPKPVNSKKQQQKKYKKKGCFLSLMLVLLLLVAFAVLVFLHMNGNVDLFPKLEQLISKDTGEKVPLINNYRVDMDTADAAERSPILAGFVKDGAGEAVEEVLVTIYKQGEDAPFVKLSSEEDGYFGWKIRDFEQAYYMVLEKAGYSSLKVFPTFSGKTASTAFLDLEMIKESSEAYDVEMEVYSAGEETKACSDAKIVFRSGYNSIEGESILEIQTDVSGKAAGQLPAGVYTAQIEKEGLATAYMVVYADGREEINRAYCLESAYANDWGVVLSWQAKGGTGDLDGCVMYDGEQRSYLNATLAQNKNGDSYSSDDTGEKGCEIASLRTEAAGTYRYFVSDYNSVQENKMDSKKLFDLNAKVWVYHKGALVQTFEASEEQGAVWSAFVIKEDMLWPDGALYTDKTGLDWFWDKTVLSLTALNDGNTVSNGHSYGRMAASGDWLYFRNPNDGNKLYYMTKDGEQVTRITDEEVKDLHAVGDYIYYAQENQSNNLVRIKNDGSERIQLTNEVLRGGGWYLSLESVIGSKLYYIYRRGETDVQISSYDMNTGGISVVKNMMNREAGRYLSPNFTGEWVYYIKADGIYRCQMDGSGEMCIKQGINWEEFVLQDGWMYYITADRKNIGCMRADGTGDMILTQPLEGGDITRLSVCKDKLYFINGAHLYQMSWDGKTHRMLSATDWYNIYDNQIYFYSQGANGTSILRSDMDGNDIRQIFIN